MAVVGRNKNNSHTNCSWAWVMSMLVTVLDISWNESDQWLGSMGIVCIMYVFRMCSEFYYRWIGAVRVKLGSFKWQIIFLECIWVISFLTGTIWATPYFDGFWKFSEVFNWHNMTNSLLWWILKVLRGI
jgi:hypothetical protein